MQLPHQRFIIILLLFACLLPVLTVQNVSGQNPIPLTPGPQNPESVPNKNNLTPAQSAQLLNALPSPQKQESVQIQNGKVNQNPNGNQSVVPANGQKLLPNANACLTFNDGFTGARFTFAYGGWGIWAANEPEYGRIKEHLNFVPETAIADRTSFKMGMDKPAHGLIVSPHFKAKAGDTVRAVVSYYINVANTQHKSQANLQRVTLHAKPVVPSAGIDEKQVPGYYSGEWKRLESRLVMTTDGDFQVVVEGINDSAIDTGIYFDNVEIWINDVHRTDCKFAD